MFVPAFLTINGGGNISTKSSRAVVFETRLGSSNSSMVAAREILTITNYARFNCGDLELFLNGVVDVCSCGNEFLVSTVSGITPNPEKCPLEKCPLRNHGAYSRLNLVLIINTFTPPTFPRFLPAFWQQIWQC
jgi:hypothetical protein